MRFAATLVASVSMITLLSTAAFAQDGSGVVVEAVGGVVMGNDERARDFANFEELDGETDFSDFFGGYAAVKIGKQVTPLIALQGGFAATRVDGSGEYDGTFLGQDKLGHLDNDIAYQTLDLTAAYTPDLGDDFQVKLSGGVRALHYENEEQFDSSFGAAPSTTVTSDDSASFYGAGPTIGAAVSKRFNGTPLGLSFAGAVSWITGVETTDYNESIGTTTEPGGDTHRKSLIDAEASAGVDFYATDSAVFTAGYRAELLTGINEFNGDDDENQLVHGPFAKFKASF